MSFYEYQAHDKKLEVKPLREEKVVGAKLNEKLPAPPFMMGVVAPRKSGKTYTVVDLLKDKDKYCGYFDFIFIWSKSYDADSKWKNLNLPKYCVFREWDAAHAERIFDTARECTRRYKRADCPKVLFIWDDMASDGVMKPHTQGLLEKIATTGRHFNVSAIFITQAYMRLSHTVRTNLTNLLVFRIRNAQEFAKISEENREALSKDEFFDIYNDVTSRPFAFLHINNQQGDPCLRFANCWSDVLKIPAMQRDLHLAVEDSKEKKTTRKRKEPPS